MISEDDIFFAGIDICNSPSTPPFLCQSRNNNKFFKPKRFGILIIFARIWQASRQPLSFRSQTIVGFFG